MCKTIEIQVLLAHTHTFCVVVLLFLFFFSVVFFCFISSFIVSLTSYDFLKHRIALLSLSLFLFISTYVFLFSSFLLNVSWPFDSWCFGSQLLIFLLLFCFIWAIQNRSKYIILYAKSTISVSLALSLSLILFALCWHTFLPCRLFLLASIMIEMIKKKSV